jgi:hypothetical protein
MRKNSEVGLT